MKITVAFLVALVVVFSTELVDSEKIDRDLIEKRFLFDIGSVFNSVIVRPAQNVASLIYNTPGFIYNGINNALQGAAKGVKIVVNGTTGVIYAATNGVTSLIKGESPLNPYFSSVHSNVKLNF